MSRQNLVIIIEQNVSKARQHEAQEFAGDHAFPWLMSIDDRHDYPWSLHFAADDLFLCSHEAEFTPIRAEFDIIPGLNHRNQPLARALGKKVKTVADVTAGFGQDSFLMAALGYQVIAIERRPAIFALLQDGLRRASSFSATESIKLRLGDARVILPELDPSPDAVYLDPMFPPKRKSSALAKKSARALRALAGEDEDKAELFKTALQCARRRVIVKQPLHADALGEKPDQVYTGKSVRYEVYWVN